MAPTELNPIENAKRTPHRVAVLGATGSIGVSTLDVLASLQRIDPEQSWCPSSLSGHSKMETLVRLAAKAHKDFPLEKGERTLIASGAGQADALARCLNEAGLSDQFRLDFGADALTRAAVDDRIETVVSAIVGRAGLESTLAAVEAGKRVALANKEALVVAGPVVTQAAAISGSQILPVDSEHSAIFQCLAESRGRNAAEGCQQDPKRATASFESNYPGVRRLILTASGGPFRDWTTEQMNSATVEQALAHPTWQMGRKISIDSASMMNKALEIIEARWLFDVPADRIRVVVHPQSLIHSMVEFEDGSVVAQVSPPDMRLPIQYALTFPRRLPCPAGELRLDEMWEMSLYPADIDRFPALGLGFEVAASGGTSGVVVNGANEAAVALFLDGKIRFTDIPKICRRTLEDHHHESNPTLTTLIELDTWSRARAQCFAVDRC